MKRTWIKGYIGRYKIQEDGKVFSFYENGKIKIMKFNLQKGYLTIALCLNSRVKRFSIHRLLFESFKGNIPINLQINHIDGNKLNNSLANLELVTPLENTRHAWRIGLSKKRLGEDTSLSKLAPSQILEIKELKKQGLFQWQIAEKFRIHQSNVSYILSGKTWSHVKA
jgi:hypothetical protein